MKLFNRGESSITEDNPSSNEEEINDLQTTGRSVELTDEFTQDTPEKDTKYSNSIQRSELPSNTILAGDPNTTDTDDDDDLSGIPEIASRRRGLTQGVKTAAGKVGQGAKIAGRGASRVAKTAGTGALMAGAGVAAVGVGGVVLAAEGAKKAGSAVSEGARAVGSGVAEGGRKAVEGARAVGSAVESGGRIAAEGARAFGSGVAEGGRKAIEGARTVAEIGGRTAVDTIDVVLNPDKIAIAVYDAAKESRIVSSIAEKSQDALSLAQMNAESFIQDKVNSVTSRFVESFIARGEAIQEALESKIENAESNIERTIAFLEKNKKNNERNLEAFQEYIRTNPEEDAEAFIESTESRTKLMRGMVEDTKNINKRIARLENSRMLSALQKVNELATEALDAAEKQKEEYEIRAQNKRDAVDALKAQVSNPSIRTSMSNLGKGISSRFTRLMRGNSSVESDS